MKKAFLLTFCAVILSGCTEQKERIFVSDSDTAASEAASATENTTVQKPTEPKSSGKASGKKTENGVEITLDNEKYNVDIENASEIVDITACDFDFDGIDDIFVNYEKYGQALKKGRYFHFDPITDTYTDWDELNEISESFLVDKQSDKTISVKFYSYYGDTTYYYKWKDSKPIPVLFLDYDLSSGYGILDHYKYDENNEKILYLREVQDISDDRTLETIDYPRYFHVNKTSVDVLKNGEIVQTIPDTRVYDYVEYLKEDYSKKVIMEGGVREPEKYIREYDFDFDGWNDICLPEYHDETERTTYCKYYHFDAETETYIPWQELNGIGKYIYPYPDTKTLKSYDSSRSAYIYKWKNGIPEIVQREEYEYVDDSHTESYKHIYDIDENGNETLVRIEH